MALPAAPPGLAEERVVVALVGRCQRDDKHRGRKGEQRRVFDRKFNKILKDSDAFTESIAAAGFDIETILGQPEALGMHGSVLALMCLVPGALWSGPLTLWSAQERTWWDCLMRPTDAFSVSVERLAVARERVEADFQQQPCVRYGFKSFLASTTETCAAQVMAGHYLVVGGAEATGLEFVISAAGRAGAALRCIVLPLPLAVAIAYGGMRTLMFTARAIYFRPRLFRAYPPAAFWRQSRQRRVHAMADQMAISLECEKRSMAAKFQRAADLVRELSGLRYLRQDDECADTVVFLQAQSDQYRNGHYRQTPHAYSCEVLIEAVVMADMLRDGSKLREIVRRSCKALLPPAQFEVVVENLNTGGIPRVSAARRARCYFDFAFAVAMRQHICAPGDAAAAPPILYGWADSSPMGGRNWLVSHFHLWRAQTASEMRAVLAAAKELATLPAPRAQRRHLRSNEDEVDDGEFIRVSVPAYDRILFLYTIK